VTRLAPPRGSGNSRLSPRQTEDEVQPQRWGPEWWLYVLLALTVLIGAVLMVRFFVALG
jgi:hypothetical protein